MGENLGYEQGTQLNNRNSGPLHIIHESYDSYMNRRKKKSLAFAGFMFFIIPLVTIPIFSELLIKFLLLMTSAIGFYIMT